MPCADCDTITFRRCRVALVFHTFRRAGASLCPFLIRLLCECVHSLFLFPFLFSAVRRSPFVSFVLLHSVWLCFRASLLMTVSLCHVFFAAFVQCLCHCPRHTNANKKHESDATKRDQFDGAWCVQYNMLHCCDIQFSTPFLPLLSRLVRGVCVLEHFSFFFYFILLLCSAHDIPLECVTLIIIIVSRK